jgi:hypothetical protein
MKVLVVERRRSEERLSRVGQKLPRLLPSVRLGDALPESSAQGTLEAMARRCRPVLEYSIARIRCRKPRCR